MLFCLELVSEYIFGDNKHDWINPIYKEENKHEAYMNLANMEHTCSYFDWVPKKNIYDIIKDTVDSLK